MASFKDNKGRLWAVELNVFLAKRVKALLGADLFAMIGEAMEPLQNPVLAVDVLYVLCKDQADSAGVSDEEFGRAMYGEPFWQARDALTEAVADFFRPREAELIRRGRTARERVQAAAVKAAQEELDKLERTALDELPRTSGTRSGGVPASSDSTPDPSPSGN